jgi:hypothetical protein
MNDTTDFSAFLASLSPEEQEQLLGMGTLDERQAMLEQQMAQAQALRQPSDSRHVTGLGAALGGLTDGLRYVQGTREMEALRAQQEGLLGKKDAGRGLFADVLRRKQAGASAAPAEVPLSPFSFTSPL